MSLSSQTTSLTEKRYWIFYGTFFRKEDAIRFCKYDFKNKETKITTLECRNRGYVFQVSFIGVKSDIIKYHSREDEYFIFNDLIEVIE
ncbi:MAG: hypothetical protein ACXACY_26210 [Candidatus Hodarchaeales archaeon]|jgi:hypothetical protein